MTTTPSSPKAFDLAVIGAGPIGAALALGAARAGFHVALVDARPKNVSDEQDGRNFAIVRGSWHLLSALGLSEALKANAEPLNGLEAVDGGTHWFGHPSALFTHEDLSSSEDGTPLGYMIEAGMLQSALDAAVDAQNKITLFRPDMFETRHEEGDGLAITLSSGKIVRAKLLAGCDGGRSAVRGALGIGLETRDYRRSVFAANVRLSRPHGGIARQLFTPEGPFATLPLSGDRANLAWYLSTGAAQTLMQLSPAEIEAELNHRFADFAGDMRLDGAPATYPLTLALAETMTGPRAALLGDAARRINPLAGQGLNLGFKDVAALVDVVIEAGHVGLDIGAPSTLERYQNWRRFDGNATALALDGLDRLFSNDHPVLKPLRGLALKTAEKLPLLRGAMARQASADQTSLPELMQPPKR